MGSRHIVTFRPGQFELGRRQLASILSSRVPALAGMGEADGEALGFASVMSSIGMVSLDLDSDQVSLLESVIGGTVSVRGQEGSALLAIEPDRPLLALPVGVDDPGQTSPVPGMWGLAKVGALTSPWTGRGIKLAVLDTAYDGTHPDFSATRGITAKSFIAGGCPDSANGDFHGTACFGLACGFRTTPGHRYGVATQATPFFGQVMRDGAGTMTSLLAGINWAVDERCDVISISMAFDSEFRSAAFDLAGWRALRRGALIVAGAGNVADGSVLQPANSIPIVAVGSVDDQLQLSSASARSGRAVGTKVDLVSPGERIYSSVPSPRRYQILEQGTSLATPIVAGVAALWAQATGARGRALWQCLVAFARPLELSSITAGAGLVQAPQFGPDIAPAGRNDVNSIEPGFTRVQVELEEQSDLNGIVALLKDCGLAVSSEHIVVGVGETPVDEQVLEQIRSAPGVRDVLVDNMSAPLEPL